MWQLHFMKTYYGREDFYDCTTCTGGTVIFTFITSPTPILTFDLITTDAASSARAGLIATDHGMIETPIFMPVGTVGQCKSCNAAAAQRRSACPDHPWKYLPLYHRPGTGVLEAAAGFINLMDGTGRYLPTAAGTRYFRSPQTVR